MAHLDPLDMGELPELQAIFQGAREAMGFVPNSMLTMAHMPQLPVAFSLLANVILGGDLRALVPTAPEPGGAEEALEPALVRLVAFASSLSAGCRYCQAHTSHSAHLLGAAEEKLSQLLNFETADVFSEPERAALALAFAAARVPNETTPAHFERLRAHYGERQIVQLVGVISLFGFLNRWNDTMATELEAAPVAFAESALGAVGWNAGKHVPPSGHS
jgi:AhpD family alkylhydroperoxidase